MEQDWTKFYFANPQPERFVQEVRSLSASGHLADYDRNLPTIVFLSRVIAANPDRLAAWLKALEDLPGADRQSVGMAAWLSGTVAAHPDPAVRAIGQQMPGEPPDFLAEAVDHPIMLDVLWLYYFATGDLRAVRRIVSALDYMGDFGAAESFRESAQTDEDKARALRDAMFQAASWSLGSLMTEYKPLQAYCGDLVRSDTLTVNERCALAIVLARVDPASWHVDIDLATKRVKVIEGGPERPAAKKAWWRIW